MSINTHEQNGQPRDSLQTRMRRIIEGSSLETGVIIEPHYSGSRVGDEFLRNLHQEYGIDPTSSTLMHVYPQKRITSWGEYQQFCQDVSALFPSLEEPGITVSIAQPKPEYDSEDLSKPGDLNLGLVDVVDNPLPSFFSLTTVVIHPTEDIARRYVKEGETGGSIKSYETIIAASELPFKLPPASRPAINNVTEISSRRGWKGLARRFAALLNKFADS